MYSKEFLLFESKDSSNYRIPSVIVTDNGTVLAFCNDRKDSLSDHADEVELVMARKELGKEWEELTVLDGYNGWACVIGSAVYDRETGTSFCTFSRTPITRDEFGKYSEEDLKRIEREAAERAEKDGIERGALIMSSTDDGLSWSVRPFKVEGRKFVNIDGNEVVVGGSCHGSAHGIQLKHGENKGRLLCPSRFAAEKYSTWDGIRKYCYNNSVYSDDHGKTWKASAPVQRGTGEGTLIENSDGSITYNSRAYFNDMKRYLATSCDGGETYTDFRCDDFLVEEKNIGCNASFLRVEREDLKNAELLPTNADSITLFVNPRAETRRNMTVCVSFDSGKTWSKTKTVFDGSSAYSSLDYSKKDGIFYLLYEKGDDKNPYKTGVTMFEFDLEWVLN